MQLRSRGYRSDSDLGAVAIVVAVCSVLIFLIAALVVDLGMTMEQRRSAQRSVDLAALAAGQELPNTGAATTVAAQYLMDNGWGTGPDGEALTLAQVTANLTNATDTDGDISFSVKNQRLDLTAPEREIDFFFAPVTDLLPGEGAFTSTRVTASAAVQIKSLGNLMPFLLPATSASGVDCLKESGPSKPPCAGSSEGNFGYIDVKRKTNDNKRLEWNIHLGLDYAPTIIPNAAAVKAAVASTGVDQQCPVGQPGIVPHDLKAPVDGFNCVGSQTGSTVSNVVQGLIEHKKDDCDGRLATTGSPSVMVAGCSVVPDQFFSYASSTDVATATIDAHILSDPRFGLVPVLSVATKPPSGSSNIYSIVDFMGVYLKGFYDSNGNPVSSGTGPIKAIDAYVFRLDQLPGIVANVGDTTAYVGSGPKVPVLVK